MVIDVVILAAGLSRRMGLCKGLLPWGEGTLLEQACKVYRHLSGQRIVVVGKEADLMKPLAHTYGFQVVVNEQPELGQGRSLALGIQAVDTTANPVLCAVVDQPLMTEAIVQALVQAYEQEAQDGKAIICPLYGPRKERGNPVIFGPYWKQGLQNITADHGGREILQGIGKPYIRFVEIKEPAGVDVDMPDEYEQLYNMWGKL